VPITGRPGNAELAGAGAIIDVAVKMRAFAQRGLWDALAARRQLRATHIDELVQVLVPFHAAAAVGDAHGSLGAPVQVRAPLLQSLDELGGLVTTAAERDNVGRLRAWEAAAFQRLQPVFAQRLAQGRVRECHGDLHLGNVTTVAGRATVFDGIDFNDDFRWIDVMSEVAFMAMDLHAHSLSPLAHRFVNGYLELGGDYDGVRVLNYYLVHRALVRAKVALLRALQCADARAVETRSARQAAYRRTAAQGYLELALRFADAAGSGAAPVLLLTHGYSGSGKSTHTQELLETLGAIRIRADIERKRLAGLQPLQRGSATALYGAAMTAAIYERLGRLAAWVLQAGYPTILDATFLRRVQRDAARRVAAEQGVAALVLHFDAPADVLRRRLHERAARGADASDADAKVLAAQLQTVEPLQADEAEAVFMCRAADAPDGAEPRVDWTPLLQRLSSAAPPRR
jgi:aminoglycoside phosphotransferase family enzyme/predicted kinase